MHNELDIIWENIDNVLKENGIVCINIGDATRKIGNNFNLYPNHARIIQKFRELNYSVLPSILWRKPTNKASKFMGSGMIPPNAYVTLEHEYILIFRKGGTRTIKDRRDERYNSAYFWEERNTWFSDLWGDITGISQSTNIDSRDVSAAYPIEIPYRLINMYSIQNDTVLDPFSGTGTTALASAASKRNSINIDIDNEFIKQSIFYIQNNAKEITKQINNTRLKNHKKFLENTNKKPKYNSNKYNFKVMTKQEKQLQLPFVKEIKYSVNNQIHVEYK